MEFVENLYSFDFAWDFVVNDEDEEEIDFETFDEEEIDFETFDFETFDRKLK